MSPNYEYKFLSSPATVAVSFYPLRDVISPQLCLQLLGITLTPQLDRRLSVQVSSASKVGKLLLALMIVPVVDKVARVLISPLIA